MTTHVLKTYPEAFQAVKAKQKLFEVRKNDRDYQVDDGLELREYDPITDKYTGQVLHCWVTYIMSGRFGIPNDVCVMSLGDIQELDYMDMIFTTVFRYGSDIEAAERDLNTLYNKEIKNDDTI